MLFDDDEIIDLREFCRITGYSKQTIYNLRKDRRAFPVKFGRLPHGRRLVCRKSDAVALAKRILSGDFAETPSELVKGERPKPIQGRLSFAGDSISG